jgi:DNA-binding winged helix-turn-helix (wHTH) protein
VHWDFLNPTIAILIKKASVKAKRFVKTEVLARTGRTTINHQREIKSSQQISYARMLLTVFNSRNFYHFLIVGLLFIICTLFYYLGELIDFAGWTALRWQFFYGVHDIQRFLFLVPIMCAGYFFGVKVMLTVMVCSFIVFLPRAIFISPFQNAIIRAMIFTMFFGAFNTFIMVAQWNISDNIMVRSKDRNFKEIQTITENGTCITHELEIDFSMRLVRRHGQIIKLTPKEYKVLEYMVRNSEKVLTPIEILRNVWGPEYAQESEYVRNFVAQLRRKIEDNPSSPRLIITEPHFGYRFINPDGSCDNHTRTVEKI